MKEHVPFDAYGLLRRIAGKGPQRVRQDRWDEDESARYLITRNLAAVSAANADRIEETVAGSLVGLIEYPSLSL